MASFDELPDDPSLGVIGRIGQHDIEGGIGPFCLGMRGHRLKVRHTQRLGVLLHMELTTLPGNASKDGPSCGFEAGVVVTNEKPHSAQAPLQQALEEGAPVDFGLRELEGDAHEMAFATGVHAQGDQHGDIAYLPVDAHALIAGVQIEIAELSQGATAPGV